MSEKPETQRVDVPGMDAHQAMGEAPPPRSNSPIPAFLMEEARRQAEGGAHFYGKRLTDCTREELYAAVVAAWYEAEQSRKAMRQQAQLAGVGVGGCRDCD